MKKLIFLIVCYFGIHVSIFSQWQLVNGPWSGYNNEYYYVYIIAINGNNILVETSRVDNISGFNIYETFLSTNNGDNWTSLNSTFKNTNISSFVENNNNIFAFTAHEIFISTNNGVHWDSINNSLSNRNILSSAIKDTIIFVGTDSGMFISSNNGKFWTACGLNNFSLNLLSISEKNIFAYSPGYHFQIYNQPSALFLSTNNGNSWVSKSSPSENINALLIHGNYIFTGVGWQGGAVKKSFNSELDNNLYGIFISQDSGQVWFPVDNGLPESAVINSLSQSGDKIFASSFWYDFGSQQDLSGVFLSQNNGNYWFPMNEGLSSNIHINNLVPSVDYLFASSNSGLWKRPLTEFVGIIGTNSHTIFNLYPNPTKSAITIQLSKIGQYCITLENLQGQEMLKKKIILDDNYTIDVSHLQNGIYIIILQNGFEKQEQKLIVYH